MTGVMTASTEWTEKVRDDEEARFFHLFVAELAQTP